MKKFVSLILSLLMLLSLVSCGGTKGEPTKEEEVKTEEPASEKEEPAEPAPWDVDGDGKLSVLGIGNSFNQDTMEYVYPIAKNLGIENLEVGNLYHGGVGLDYHANSLRNDTEDYIYFESKDPDGKWDVEPTEKISNAVKSHDWDYIVFTANSLFTMVEDRKEADWIDLAFVVEYLRENAPGAKLAWNMTWAYPADSSYDIFFNYYHEDQQYMYETLSAIAEEQITASGLFDYILPVGTALQNTRPTSIGDRPLHRDHYHLSNGIGRYIAGLTAVKTLTGIDISGLTYAPDGVTEEQIAIAVESVNNAYESPFEITQSAYHVEN